MSLNSTILSILEEQSILKTSKTKPLVNAITNRNPITFYYSGPRKGKDSVKSGTRINGEAVALGLSKKGNLIIRVFVPSPNVSKKGFNKTNWRTFMVSRMSNVKIDDTKTFDQQRPQYKSGDDDSMTVTYVTTDWGKKPEVKKPRIVKPLPSKKIEPKKEVLPTEPQKPEELPQPKPVSKPEAPQMEPKVEPKPIEKPLPPKEEPKPLGKEKSTELPQPTPQEKPSVNPEEDQEDNKLQESLKRIKRLMF